MENVCEDDLGFKKHLSVAAIMDFVVAYLESKICMIL